MYLTSIAVLVLKVKYKLKLNLKYSYLSFYKIFQSSELTILTKQTFQNTSLLVL